MREDIQLFLDCVRFSSREQVRQVHQYLETGGSSGAVDDGCAVLIDLIPKLRRAEPRIRSLLESPLLVQTPLRRQLETLRGVTEKALKRYEGLASATAASRGDDLPRPNPALAKHQCRATDAVASSPSRLTALGLRLTGKRPAVVSATERRRRQRQQQQQQQGGAHLQDSCTDLLPHHDVGLLPRLSRRDRRKRVVDPAAHLSHGGSGRPADVRRRAAV